MLAGGEDPLALYEMLGTMEAPELGLLPLSGPLAEHTVSSREEDVVIVDIVDISVNGLWARVKCMVVGVGKIKVRRRWKQGETQGKGELRSRSTPVCPGQPEVDPHP